MYATSFMDGLDSAFSDFNAEGDMGDAEVWEQQMPQLWLAREIRKDGGGFGRFRGGNGIHSLYLIPESIDMEIGSFGSPPIFSTAGLMGGYPAAALRVWIGRGTNVKEQIEAGKLLPNTEGADRAIPLFVEEVEADWRCVLGQNVPTASLEPYSLFSVVSGDGGGYGDPLLRSPADVIRDYTNGLSGTRVAADVYGVVITETPDPNSDGSGVTVGYDKEATDALRAEHRRQRLQRAIPAAEYKKRQRERLLAGDIPVPARAMYRDVMEVSPAWATEFRTFWDLPDDFEVPQ
jgi:acetone carboxylase alpha subunit